MPLIRNIAVDHGFAAGQSVGEKLRRRTLAVATALTASIGAVGDPRAQTSYQDPLDEWDNDWTVLTMAPDGAWGVATDVGVLEALARAISNCKAMSGAELGCGAQFTAVQAGWSLGIRCGNRNILIAENSLDDAEVRASWREFELRKLYAPDMPPCVVVVTVDPAGEVVPPDDWFSGQIHPWE